MSKIFFTFSFNRRICVFFCLELPVFVCEIVLYDCKLCLQVCLLFFIFLQCLFNILFLFVFHVKIFQMSFQYFGDVLAFIRDNFRDIERFDLLQ